MQRVGVGGAGVGAWLRRACAPAGVQEWVLRARGHN